MNVIITGASSGIGSALAVRVARHGGHVFLAARREDKLRDVAEAVTVAGGTAHVIVADVRSSDDCERIVSTALAHTHIDVLVNNAGRGHRHSVEDTSDAIIEEMFAVNVFSLMRLTRLMLPHMKQRKSGHIINIASVAGKMGFPYNSAYVAAKHAVVGFTAALRTELVRTGVEATVICPGGVSTDWASVTDGGPLGDVFARGIRASRDIANELNIPLAPLSRMMTAEAIAEIIEQTLDAGRTSDVMTHAGTLEQAVEAVTNRTALENAMLPLYLGMRRAMEE